MTDRMSQVQVIGKDRQGTPTGLGTLDLNGAESSGLRATPSRDSVGNPGTITTDVFPAIA